MSDLSFAKVAVSKGFITPDQLREALGIKKRVEDAGLSEDLGAILLKKGWLRPEQLAEIHAGLDQGVRELIQGYDILATIGRGGMGTVYKAKRQSDGTTVAIKTLLPNFAREKDAVERFLREAQALKKLHHPNIVQAMDAGYQNGLYYCVMEYVEGDTLAQTIKRRCRLPWRDAVKVVKSVAFALDHASRYGVIHRDIKPDNLIITPGGGLKITDLGLAKMISGRKDEAITQSGFVLGTPAFMSPEQVRGSKGIDVRSDIYSLGITFYASLTGEAPFRDENPLVVLQLRLKQDVPFGALRDLGVPQEVIDIGRKMTMRDPAHRYQSPNELIEALMALEAGHKSTRRASAFGGGLFGRIAVLNGFMTAEQLDRAIAIQEELLQRGVKRPIGEILLDEGLINRRQLKKILSLQSFYDRRNSERKIADLIVRTGFATTVQVQDALARQKDVYMLEGRAPTLDQILHGKGTISEQQRKAILRMRRRLEAKESGVVRDTMIGVKECSRCLEVIPLNASQCPRCDHFAAESGVEVRCRACGRLQTEPGEFCPFCGANPVSGRRPDSSKLKTCPKCGKYAAFYQLRCTACKALLPGSLVRRVLRSGQSATRSFLRHWRGAMLLAGILFAGYLLITRTTRADRFWLELLEGDSASVRFRVEDLLIALKHRDYPASLTILNTPADEAGTEQAVAGRAVARIFHVPEGGLLLQGYRIERILVDEERARAYVEASFVPEDRPDEPPQKRSVTIQLRRENGAWIVEP